MMHENPFMLQAGRENDAEKEGDRYKRMDRRIDACLLVVYGQNQWYHYASQMPEDTKTTEK